MRLASILIVTLGAGVVIHRIARGWRTWLDMSLFALALFAIGLVAGYHDREPGGALSVGLSLAIGGTALFWMSGRQRSSDPPHQAPELPSQEGWLEAIVEWAVALSLVFGIVIRIMEQSVGSGSGGWWVSLVLFVVAVAVGFIALGVLWGRGRRGSR